MVRDTDPTPPRYVARPAVPADKRRWTIAILIGATVALIAWDVYVVVATPAGDEISAVVLGWAQQHPVIPFALGVLMGHLCWPQRARPVVRT